MSCLGKMREPQKAQDFPRRPKLLELTNLGVGVGDCGQVELRMENTV